MKKILIIDDEEAICQTLKTFLSANGFDVSTLTNPSDALNMPEIYDYDLLIMDYMMPGLPGYTLSCLLALRDLSGQKRLPPIVVVTGYPDEKEVAEWGRTEGVHAVLPKPFKLDELLDTITGILNKRLSLSS